MILIVETPKRTERYADHDSWVVGTEGELDVIHRTGVTTTTFASGAWLSVAKTLEDAKNETWDEVSEWEKGLGTPEHPDLSDWEDEEEDGKD